MIEQCQAEEAIHSMLDNATALGAAKEELLRAESYLERVEAMGFLSIKDGSVESRKMQARVLPEYLKASEEMFKAAAKYETLKHLQEAHRATISVFQTQSANTRSFSEAAHYGVREPRRNPRTHQRGYERSAD